MSSILHGPSVQLKVHMVGVPFHHEPKRKLMSINLGLSHRLIRPDFSSDFIDRCKYENVVGVGGVPGRGEGLRSYLVHGNHGMPIFSAFVEK